MQTNSVGHGYVVSVPHRYPIGIKQQISIHVRNACASFGCEQCAIRKRHWRPRGKRNACIGSEIPVVESPRILRIRRKGQKRREKKKKESLGWSEKRGSKNFVHAYLFKLFTEVYERGVSSVARFTALFEFYITSLNSIP
jgi:hypothetical protein